MTQFYQDIILSCFEVEIKADLFAERPKYTEVPKKPLFLEKLRSGRRELEKTN